MVKRFAYAFARAAAPALHKIRLNRGLNALEAYSAFLTGRGSGHGWDNDNDIKAMASFVPKGTSAVIFDVGANNGSWSKEMARVLGSRENRFFLFECAHYCFEGIEQRLAEIPNAYVVKRAVSDHNGVAILHQPRRGSGLASLHKRDDVGIVHQEYDRVSVKTITLDKFCERHGVARVDLLKMDIEGHELHALQGAKDLLSSHSVRTIAFEFGSANVNSRTFFRDFWELLGGYGYSISRIVPGGGLTRVPHYSENLEYFRGATNYIATL